MNRWGGPPGPRPTPSSAFVNWRKKPARGPAADQGVRPTRLRQRGSRPFSRESRRGSLKAPEGRATSRYCAHSFCSSN